MTDLHLATLLKEICILFSLRFLALHKFEISWRHNFQGFDTPEEVKRYEAMMDYLCKLVVSLEGSLKAEHGGDCSF